MSPPLLKDLGKEKCDAQSYYDAAKIANGEEWIAKFKKAAGLGHPEALDKYAYWLKSGSNYYIGKNLEESFYFYYFLASSEKPNKDAVFQIGEFYLNGFFVEKDLNEAKEWFNKAEKLGSPMAQSRIKEIDKLEENPGGLENPVLANGGLVVKGRNMGK